MSDYEGEPWGPVVGPEQVKQWSFVKFEQACWDVIPRLAIGFEPGAWGYPATRWIAWGWLKWSWQLSWYKGNRLPK